MTAGPSPGSRSTTATARTAPERCRNSRRATTTASSSPTEATSSMRSSSTYSGSSPVPRPLRVGGPLQAAPVELDEQVLRVHAREVGGRAVDHLDDLDGAPA